MKKRTDHRRFWQGVDGYKLGAAVVLGLVALFFLLVTIMPIILFKALEDASWELKTFATSYRPVAALVGLILFLVTGWSFLRVVRGQQILARPRRRTTKPAEPAVKPEEIEQPAPGAAEDAARPENRDHATPTTEAELTWPTPGVTEPVFMSSTVAATEQAATEASSSEAVPAAEAVVERV